MHSIIFSEKVKTHNPLFYLSILNSKLFWFFIVNTSTALRGNAYRLTPEFLENFCFPEIDLDINGNKKTHDKLVLLVDKMLSLNKQLNSINIDFDRYVNTKPRISDIYLKSYVGELDVNNKEVLNDANRIEGKIREFEIMEEGEWLVFKVEYERKTKEGKLYRVKIRAFKCKFADEKLRKFLYYSIKTYTRAGMLGKGNLYERILKVKIPHFDPNPEKNLKIIYGIVKPYLKATDEYNKIRDEINKIDETIDQKVYELYGLTKDEIKIVEESAGGK
jgi:hypothetical protein